MSVRLDPRVLRLRGKGEGPLIGIHDILMNLMDAERRTGSGKWSRSQVPKPGTWGTRLSYCTARILYVSD